jgi:hypothetical protein
VLRKSWWCFVKPGRRSKADQKARARNRQSRKALARNEMLRARRLAANAVERLRSLGAPDLGNVGIKVEGQDIDLRDAIDRGLVRFEDNVLYVADPVHVTYKGIENAQALSGNSIHVKSKPGGEIRVVRAQQDLVALDESKEL